MARTLNRLTQLRIDRAKGPGNLSDGGGLYLQITETHAKSWIYRYQLNGVTRYMGLGPLADVSLAEARAAASEARELRRKGIDPLDNRKTLVAAQRLEAARATTFRQAAEDYIEAHKAGWRNAKHAAQWTATLDQYAYPVIGSKSVQEIDTADILKVLQPIWTTKPETASRVRGRVEVILDAATSKGQRTGENPARWRGHMKNLLPPKTRVRRIRHHPALPYDQIPAFMAALRQERGKAAQALELLILTAARTGEVIGAQIPEFDLKAAVWTVPADRMKSGRDHRVPLSDAALDVLRDAIGKRTEGNLFPGARPGRPLSNMAMAVLLRRMQRHDITVHGFRSTFRDWAAERTHYPREVCEMALAHTIDSKVEASYRRGDMFEKRRQLMDAWAKFCTEPGQENVVRLPTAG